MNNEIREELAERYTSIIARGVQRSDLLEAHAEIEVLRAQIAELTPTPEQVKRRELGELAREADAKYSAWQDDPANDDNPALRDAAQQADLAYIAARDAAKGAA